MTLTALEMQGFKSFPEKTTLNFGKGITAVVGPNGSGKSNISDAVRWVLGEQSSKSLRGSKMEDVIFDGTKLRKAHGFAQVTLRLDNKDRALKGYDTDEVSVTRKYYRSGESEYKINGIAVRLKDVHELFMDTGLGRDGYSMVSQGKIADMVSGKGKECREMLEEAAGISSYRYRRNDSLKKLSQAEENLVRLRDILTELESRIGPLKHQSEKAEKFIVLAEEKKTIEIGLWLYNIDKLKADLSAQQDKIAIAQNQYDSAEGELSEIESMIEQCMTDTQNINIRIDEIRNGISELEEKAASSMSEQAVLRNSIEHNNETIDRIGRDRTDSESNRKQLLKEIETEEKLISQIRRIREEKSTELQKTRDFLEKMQLEGGNLDEESAEISKNIAVLTNELSDARVVHSTLLSSVTEIKTRVETIESLVIGKQEIVDDLSSQNGRIELEKQKCEKEIAECTNAVNGYSLRLNGKNEKADSLKKELDDKTFEAQRTISKIKMLEELEKNMEGYSGAVKKVIKESQKGALKGIHGTISQLISVKSEYAVAIETALGNSIQNIVTDTENDAKNAINFLKAGNAGRATFQPISAIKGKSLDEKNLDDCYGYIDTAVNLITYKDIYAEIISSLLGKVVVCEDLTSAIAIAKKYEHRFKIVTLDGQVINAGGSMTGGSQAQSTGILSRGTEIERLKEKDKKLTQELAEKQESYDKLCNEIRKLTAELENEKAELSNLQEEKIRLEGEYNLISQQLLTAKNDLNELKSEKNSADERISSIEKSIEAKKEQTEKLSEEIGNAEKRLLSLSGRKTELS
ncbi:MAG: chromosome segregation protein SMC [Clostridia bacterium]|nr:chromosome segregation protein SMC [Clostridia bacterium]